MEERTTLQTTMAAQDTIRSNTTLEGPLITGIDSQNETERQGVQEEEEIVFENSDDDDDNDEVVEAVAPPAPAELERQASIAACRSQVLEMMECLPSEETSTTAELSSVAAAAAVGAGNSTQQPSNESVPETAPLPVSSSSGSEVSLEDESYSLQVMHFLRSHGMDAAAKELSDRLRLARDRESKPAEVESSQSKSLDGPEIEKKPTQSGAVLPPSAAANTSASEGTSPPVAPTRTESQLREVHRPRFSGVLGSNSDMHAANPSSERMSFREKVNELLPGVGSASTPGAVAISGLSNNDADEELESVMPSLNSGESSRQSDAAVSSSRSIEEGQEEEAGLTQTGRTPSRTSLESGTTAITATAVVDIVSVEATQVNPNTDSPNASEYLTGIEDGNKDFELLRTKQKHRKARALYIFFGILTIAIIVTGVMLSVGRINGNSDSSQTMNPYDAGVLSLGATGAPTQSPTVSVTTLAPTLSLEGRWDFLWRLAESISGNETIYDTDSSHYRTIQWMAEEDVYQPAGYTLGNQDKVAQRYIVALLYFQTGGENWNDPFRFLSAEESECYWIDETVSSCDPDGYIKNLDIPINNLVGSLPHELTYLTRLERLNLDGNAGITGTLPEEIGRLSHLEFLGLTEASIQGSLPDQFYALTQLHSVYMYKNQLTGSLSTAIGGMSSLKRLIIGDNDFVGMLPEEFYNVTTMVEVDLTDNGFTGTISERIQFWAQIEDIKTWRNLLSGTVPTILGGLSQLTNLQISVMQLTGTIPTELGQLTQLSRLALSYNLLTGTLPYSFLQLEALQKLYLQGNELHGDVSFLCEAFVGPLDPFRIDLDKATCTCCSCC